MEKVDAYSILGVRSDSKLEQIKAAYKLRAFLHHPDRGGKVESFLKIQRAYDILSVPIRRLKEGALRQFDPMPLRLQPSLSQATQTLFQNLELLAYDHSGLLSATGIQPAGHFVKTRV